MPASVQQDRSRLDGFELEVFEAVRLEATPEQWREWLRVPLEHAATKGDINLFTRLMDAGADGSAGYRGCFGRTLLGAAAYGQNEEMVLALLKAGAQDDVNVKFGSNRESALHNAACFGAAKLATDSDSGGSGGSGGCYESGGGGGGTRGKARTDLARLVGRVVNLDIDGIFRLVVAFL
eukprot:g13501.t1